MTVPVAQENYGKKIDYDPQWKGPLSIERKKTDFPFIVSLGVYLAVWIGISIYAFNTGKVKIDNDIKNDLIHDSDVFEHSILAAKNIALRFILLATFLSLTYIILLRWFAKTIVYTAIFTLCAVLFSVICLFSYLYANDDNNSSGYIVPLIASIIVFVITIIIFIVLRKKIKIACSIVKESSKVVIFFPSSLVFPILPYVLYGIAFVFSGSTFIYLSAVPKDENNETPGHIYFFHLINIFGILWMTCFINAFSQMILSGTFATWYWTLDKRYVPNNTLLSFMNITARHHLGTLAFGSLIIALCKFIQILLRAIANRLKGSCNPFACLLLGWYKYMFGNLENFLRYINLNAYIMSSIHGTTYYESAKDAFNLLMRNILNVLVINKVTEAILVLGQLLVIAISALATYGYCQNLGIEGEIQTNAIILVVLSTIAITWSFFMVLRVAIATVFLCVLEDYERNDGSPVRPYFMSFELKTLLLQSS